MFELILPALHRGLGQSAFLTLQQRRIESGATVKFQQLLVESS